MPEGPECRQIAMQLSQCLTDTTLSQISILSGRYSRHDSPHGFSQFTSSLPLKVLGAGVHGKFIYILLGSEWSIWCTLGMTGGWSQSRSSHARLEFQIQERGALYFNDVRNFGTLKFVKGKEELIEKLSSLGPDMLSEDISDTLFQQSILSRPNKTIAQALMDQSTIAGVGNYIKAESLYLAKISPHRICKDLSQLELVALNRAIKSVTRESFENGGATLQSYKDLSGEPGRFNEQFCVYGKSLDPSGRDVIRERTKDGRTTHWVPTIQV
tara:strand:- start:52 stop:861 length:810 start_codon:yes stop_codon:yes gene_type:complete